MTKFGFENQSESIDETVNKTEISSEASKKAELNEIRRKQMELLEEAEKVEQRYSGNNISVSNLWDRAMEDIVTIYNQGEEIVGMKKFAYDSLKKVGVNMYEREANKKIDAAEKLATKMQRKLDNINNKLENNIGEKGLAVTLKENTEVATATANALVQTRKTKKALISEITKKQSELKVQYKQAEANPDKDYSADIEYTNTKINELETEKEGLIEDERKLGNKLTVYDTKVETKDVIVSSIGLVYTEGKKAYEDLVSEIEIGREFIKNSRFIGDGLGGTIVDVEEIVAMTGLLAGGEKRLGKALYESVSAIKQKMAGITRFVRDKGYLNKIKAQTNISEQESRDDLNETINKYATVPVK